MTGVPAEWGSVNASECESVAGREVRKKVESNVIHYIAYSTQNYKKCSNKCNNGSLVQVACRPYSL